MAHRVLLVPAILAALVGCRETDWVDTADPLVRDGDGDGFAAADDCDDDNDAVHPGAVETCDGIDEDCNGAIDDGAEPATFYADEDGDGYGDEARPTEACVAPEGHVAEAGDCDDTDPAFNPAASENDCTDPADYDCDGSSPFEDADADGFPACEDCNDQDAAVSPDAIEICDGTDNDCDGEHDEPGALGAQTWYRDLDADGHGDPLHTAVSCTAPTGFVASDTDCDDGNAQAHPGHEEVCDGADNDCDGVADVGASDATLWFDDADDDGFGDPVNSVLACEPPEGFLADDTDCDDGEPTVFPGATELCDGLDNDCNDAVDDDATGMATWYADDDDDGFGRDGSTITTCSPPPGYATSGGDCDDGDTDVHPDASERCDGIDNDCDLQIDEPDAEDARAWHLDADTDGFGTTGADEVACEAPAGFVDNTDDCDDGDGTVNPTATEVCDGIDNDCSGSIDEDTAADASTWYPDADDDGFGDPASPRVACDAPADHVSDGTDCDDGDPAVHPDSADVVADGVDDDCDGTPDQDVHLGTGADGSLNVAGTVQLDTWVPPSRTTPFAVGYGVLDIDGTQIGLDAPADGLAPGDEVLLINLQGSAARHASVGRYALHRVASVTGSSVELTQPVSVILGQAGNSDLTDQTIVLQRVPNFTWVNVAVGTELTVSPWTGGGGGVLAFRSNDVVAVRNGAQLHVDAAGYWGGETGADYNCDGTQGESYMGPGVGGNTTGCTGGYNHANGTAAYVNNAGAGGCHITGAGGEYGGGAEATGSWNGTSPPAQAGSIYGSADLDSWFFGSGGGGVWNGPPDPGPGGDGAGILFVTAGGIETHGTGRISAAGGSTTHWSTGSWTYGAGGGAGGTVWLTGETLDLQPDSVLAGGGLGTKSGVSRPGGNGGIGRIRLNYETINGVNYGDLADAVEADAAAEPDAFRSGVWQP